MMPGHFHPQTRRHRIRLTVYALFLCAVLFGTIGMQMHLAADQAVMQNRICRSVLAHMNEENDALRQAIYDRDTASVRHHADTLCGYASLFDTLRSRSTDAPLLDALADTALFYSALSDAAQKETEFVGNGLPFWERAVDTVSSHMASMALSLSDRMNPAIPTETEAEAAALLSAFSASFRPETIRITVDKPTKFLFEREPIISLAQARQILRGVIGNTVSFLGNTVTDDAHGCYIFSCQNGYAEISRCGGHLLSYAFYPRGSVNEHSILLNDRDLSELAAAFLKKAGLPSSDLSVLADRHGIRIFASRTTDNRTVTVGVRMHDGAVVSLQAESYYIRMD